MVERYWVIFDISTMPEYYQDVHNLLALPEEACIDYEYRCKVMEDHPFCYITNEAIKMIENGIDYPKDILLMYCQHNNYIKGNPIEYGNNENSIFIATRVAYVENISIIGYNMHFKMKLKGYPDNNDPEMLNFIKYLKNFELTPFNYNFVLLSSNEIGRKLIDNSTIVNQNDVNWQSIVNKFEKTQFNGDVFWRISKITRKAENIKILYKNRRNLIIAKSGYKLDFSICSFTSKYNLSNQKIFIKIDEPVQLDKNEMSVRQYTIDSFSITLPDCDSNNVLIIGVKSNENYPKGSNLEFDIITKRRFGRKVIDFIKRNKLLSIIIVIVIFILVITGIDHLFNTNLFTKIKEFVDKWQWLRDLLN